MKKSTAAATTNKKAITKAPAPGGVEEPLECICCSDPIRVYSFGPCNHKDTCASCSLKRRLLYTDQSFCPLCKEDQTPLVLTLRGDLDFASFDTSAAAAARVQAGVARLAQQNAERIQALLRQAPPRVPFPFRYARALRSSTPSALHGIFCDTPELAFAVSSLLEYACPVCSEALEKAAKQQKSSTSTKGSSEKEEEEEEKKEVSSLGAVNPQCRYLVSYESMEELKKHLSSVHKMTYCDICLADRKVFLRDQHLFESASELYEHTTNWDYGVSDAMEQLANEQKEMYEKAYRKRTAAGRQQQGLKEGKWKPLVRDIQRGHPLCEFCNKRFYGADQLYAHLNRDHEACPLCDRLGKRWQYFRDMNDLIRHYGRSHYLCKVPGCQLGFTDVEELRAHELCVHGIGGKLTLEPSFHFGHHSSSPQHQQGNSHRAMQASASSVYATPHFNGTTSTSTGGGDDNNNARSSSRKRKGKKGSGNGSQSMSPALSTSPKPHTASSSTTPPPAAAAPSQSPTQGHSLHIVRPGGGGNDAAVTAPTNTNLRSNGDDDNDDDDDDSNFSLNGIVATRGTSSLVVPSAVRPTVKSRSAEAEERERELAEKQSEAERLVRERQERRERGPCVYSIPATVSNKELMREMTEYLSADEFASFKKVSANFKNGVINANVYFRTFFEIFRGFSDKAISIFLRLIAVLPDKKRQATLLALLNKWSENLYREQCRADAAAEAAALREQEEERLRRENPYAPPSSSSSSPLQQFQHPLRPPQQFQTNNPYGTSKKDLDDNFPSLPSGSSGITLYRSEGRTSPTAVEHVAAGSRPPTKAFQEEFPALPLSAAPSKTKTPPPASRSPSSYSAQMAAAATATTSTSTSSSSSSSSQQKKQQQQHSTKKKGTEEFPSLPRSAAPPSVVQQQQVVSKKIQQRREARNAYQKYLELERRNDDYYDGEEDEHRKYVMESNGNGENNSKISFERPQQQHQQHYQNQPVPTKNEFPVLPSSTPNNRKKKGGKK